MFGACGSLRKMFTYSNETCGQFCLLVSAMHKLISSDTDMSSNFIRMFRLIVRGVSILTRHAVSFESGCLGLVVRTPILTRHAVSFESGCLGVVVRRQDKHLSSFVRNL